MSISHRSGLITNWANSPDTGMDALASLRKTLEHRNPTQILGDILQTVKHPDVKKPLSHAALVKIQNATQALSKEVQNSKSSTFARMVSQCRGRSPQTLEKDINKKLLTLQIMKMRDPKTPAAEVIALATSTLPHMSKADREQFCQNLVESSSAVLKTLLEGDNTEAAKAIAKALFQTGKIHVALCFMSDKETLSPAMETALKAGIKETLKLQKNWFLAKFTSDPTYSIPLPHQHSGTGSGGLMERHKEVKTRVDSLIADAALEKASEAFEITTKNQKNRFKNNYALFALEHQLPSIVFSAKAIVSAEEKGDSYNITV